MTETQTDEITYTNPAGTYTVRFWIGEDGIVYSKALGFETLESSKEVVRILEDYHLKRNEKLLLCLDASEFSGLAPESRKYMRDHLLRSDSFTQKFAVIGGNILTRTLFNMYSKIADIPMKVFKTSDEGVAWLKAL